ncbi:sphingosine kinase 1, partial [Reticulomyxa filosa]
IETTCAGHATEIARDMDLNMYDGILVLGGDGILSGTFFFFLKKNKFTTNLLILVRKKKKKKKKKRDVERALKMPLSILPCGSGNALACELGWRPLLNGVRYLLDGLYIPLDAYVAQQYNSKNVLGFVSTQWAIVSAVDLESDAYRWMGKLRFDFKAFLEFAKCKFYDCRIYYRQVPSKPLKKNKKESELNEDQQREQEDHSWWMKLDHDHPESFYNQTNTDTNQTASVVFPKDWKKVEDKIGLCCITNYTTISESVLMGGDDMTLNNGVLKLVYSTKTHRGEYFNILMSMDTGISYIHYLYYNITYTYIHIYMYISSFLITGKFAKSPSVKSVKIVEAVIEPLEKGPPIDVDGEARPTKPTYLKVLPHKLVVAC